ncbi:putative disease resistance protein RPP1 [Cardamine amara subsp. amara]|uniref:Disease resistance protein RPP1 n=1 Tax=Cardamine amara subsp. amara TaxID=228776 RepID=A0ABD1BW73_CARAN
MGSSFLLGTIAGATAAVGCFTLYKIVRYHRGNKEMDSYSSSLSSPPSLSPPPSSLPPSSPQPLLSTSSPTSLSPPPSSLPPSSPQPFLSTSSPTSLSPPPSSLPPSSPQPLLSTSSPTPLSPPPSSLPPSSPPSFLPPSSPPSSSSQTMTHSLFSSFHGPDVRKSFMSHFRKELLNKGITPFFDDDIERGKSIGPELIDAIRRSSISIVVFSKNFASSSWCLDELAEISKCRELGQKVMTVFHEVDPTDVKKQTGDFGVAFKNTCMGRQKEEIERWRRALAEVATIAGEHSSKWFVFFAFLIFITTCTQSF